MSECNLSTLTSANLMNKSLNDYPEYALYVENRNNEDEPLEGNYSLYSVFNNGLEILREGGWEITIGERLVSKDKILSINNFDKITSIFGNVTPEIDYEGINNLISSLNATKPSSETTAIIFNWLSKFVDFSINRNPENANETNLILVKSLFSQDDNGHSYIQRITESILNKIFRNLIQLIRVKHDYRLYGKGSTIFGGNAIELSSQQKIGKMSGLNPACWQQFSGNYIVGKTAYGDNIVNISSTINGSLVMSPFNCYGVAPHTHTVNILQGKIPSTIGGGEFSVVQSYKVKDTNFESKYVNANDNNYDDWEAAFKSSKLIGPPAGFTSGTDVSATMESSGSWGYSWNSKNAKLPSTTNMTTDSIFKKDNTSLPTYSSYVWQWTGDDDTNITSPKANIKE